MSPETTLPYSFTATVLYGDGYGHVLGYPTANVDFLSSGVAEVGLDAGVYAGYVQLKNRKRYKAGIVIGSEDVQGVPKMEAHLLGFEGDLYGSEVRFEIVHFIRAYKIFPRVDDLIAQIGSDIEEVKRILD